MQFLFSRNVCENKVLIGMAAYQGFMFRAEHACLRVTSATGFRRSSVPGSWGTVANLDRQTSASLVLLKRCSFIPVSQNSGLISCSLCSLELSWALPCEDRVLQRHARKHVPNITASHKTKATGKEISTQDIVLASELEYDVSGQP